MKLTFIRATHEVTGSCSLIEIGSKYAIVDCGMEQGQDIYENIDLPVSASMIDYVFVTHAHIDHTGCLPLLYKYGFRGKVFATGETANLCDIMLRDSANIQMFEAEYQSKKSKRAGGDAVEPLYDLDDVAGLLKLFRPCEYGRVITVDENIAVRFTDVGHLLGSASVELFLSEDGIEKKIVFSGDIGNTNQPIINDPKTIEETDYLVIESTYGDRLHEKVEGQNSVEALAQFIQRTMDRGGNVIIPSFAIGRTQEMLYFIRQIKNEGLVHGHDGFPVYVDSPLANEATAIFLQCDPSCLDEETRAVMAKGQNPLVFEGLHTFVTTEESKKLNSDMTPKVIISASGMCDAGRIKHHLKHNLWREESLILFVGYQANGTLGRIIYEGAKSVKIFGDEIAVKAEVALLPGLSGHADKQGLIDWVKGFSSPPAQIFVNHGEDSACMELARYFNEEMQLNAYCPYSGSVYDLAKGEWIKITDGILASKLSKKKEKKKASASSAFHRLVAAAERLLSVVKGCEGMANKELAKFTDKIDSITNQLK